MIHEESVQIQNQEPICTAIHKIIKKMVNQNYGNAFLHEIQSSYFFG